jgi:hypothetical protein
MVLRRMAAMPVSDASSLPEGPRLKKKYNITSLKDKNKKSSREQMVEKSGGAI